MANLVGVFALSHSSVWYSADELNRNKNNFLWECNNGRLQYTEDNHQMSRGLILLSLVISYRLVDASVDRIMYVTVNGTLDASSDNDDSRMPGIFCNQGWSSGRFPSCALSNAAP